jgi:hypothetical protein
MGVLTITLATLKAEVQRFMGYGRSTVFSTLPAAYQGDVTSIINRGLRQFYFPPILPGETSAHQWSFLRYHATINLPAPVTTTATCTVVNGLVTFSGAANVVDATYKHTVIKFTSTSGYYEISTVVGGTQVRLRDSTINISTATTATFYWNRADMDNSGIDVNIYNGIDTGRGKLKNVNSAYLLNLEQNQVATHIGYPELFSVEAGSWPVAGGQAEQSFHLRFYPFANQATSLTLRQRLAPDGLSNDADSPLGGVAHYETIVASCLAIAEEFGDTPSSKYRELFMQRLTASIMADRTGMYASNFGYNGDSSDDRMKLRDRVDTVSYVGPATP